LGVRETQSSGRHSIEFLVSDVVLTARHSIKMLVTRNLITATVVNCSVKVNIQFSFAECYAFALCRACVQTKTMFNVY